jgi:hypothetical protein
MKLLHSSILAHPPANFARGGRAERIGRAGVLTEHPSRAALTGPGSSKPASRGMSPKYCEVGFQAPRMISAQILGPATSKPESRGCCQNAAKWVYKHRK